MKNPYVLNLGISPRHHYILLSGKLPFLLPHAAQLQRTDLLALILLWIHPWRCPCHPSIASLGSYSIHTHSRSLVTCCSCGDSERVSASIVAVETESVPASGFPLIQLCFPHDPHWGPAPLLIACQQQLPKGQL